MVEFNIWRVYELGLHWIVNWDYRDADKSLVQPTSRCILYDGVNI